MDSAKTPVRKRLFTEIEENGDLEPTNNVDVHGAIVSLSPLKQGRGSSYFEGTISDGNSHVRLMGFKEAHQKALSFGPNCKAK